MVMTEHDVERAYQAYRERVPHPRSHLQSFEEGWGACLEVVLEMIESKLERADNPVEVLKRNLRN